MSKGFSLSETFFFAFCEIHFEVLFLFETITNCFVLFILCILRYNWFSFSVLTMLFHISPLRISYNMFWSSLPFFPNNSQILPVSHPCKLMKKKNKLCQFVLPMDFGRCGLPLEHDLLTKDLRKKTDCPFSSSKQLPIAPLLGVGGCVQLPFPCWDLIWLGFAQWVCILSQLPWVHMRSCIAMSRRYCFLLINTDSGSYIRSNPLLQWSLKLGMR